MPIYEYRCPRGHVFELFQRFDDEPSETCEICGASPVTKVLYPVAVHFKGSGFYSTDYGRGSGKQDADRERASEGGSDAKPEKTEKTEKTEKKTEDKKAQAAEA